MAQIGVSDQTPTVSRLIQLEPEADGTKTTVLLPVPLSILVKVKIYIPIGCNYSIGVGVGFNGRKLIPIDEPPNDYLFGPGEHHHPAGWQVQDAVSIFFLQNNRLPHRIYVALDLDRRPTQAPTTSNLIVPR